MYTVYKVISPSDKVYIGITSKSLARRQNQHRSSAKSGSTFKLHSAIRKYGFNKLVWSIEYTSECWETIKLKEQEYIKAYDSFKKGYNMTLGGEGQLGRTFSHTEDTKLKIKTNNAKYWTGKSRSIETKQKISSSQIGVNNSTQTNKLIAKAQGSKEFIVYKDSSYVGTWINKSECQRALNIDRSIIADLLERKYKRKTHHNGYTFEYKDNL